MLDIDLDSLEDEASDGPEQTDLTGPKLLTATDRNLATAFTELLSGKKVPSELKILNVEDGQENLKLQQDLAKAAVKVATALMMTKPGRETTLGFAVGDFTVELTRDGAGKFSLTIEGLQNEDGGGVFTKEIAVNDADSRFISEYGNRFVVEVPKDSSPEILGEIERSRQQTESEYLKFMDAEAQQFNLLYLLDLGFKYPLDKMWDKRPVVPDYTHDENQGNAYSDLSIGNYLLPKEQDPLYDLHRQYIEARSKIDEETIEQLNDCILSLGTTRDELERYDLVMVRSQLDELKAKPEIADLLSIAGQMQAILKERMVSTLGEYKDKMPIANIIKTDVNLARRQDLTSSTIKVVYDKISGDNNKISYANAKKFASNNLGYSTGELLFNIDKRTRGLILRRSVINSCRNDRFPR